VLGVRLGADDPVHGGVALADVVAVACALDATGSVDYVSTTTGVATTSLHRVEASMATAPGHALSVARALRAAISIPVVGVGRLVEPQQAEQALADGDCDLVAVVRGQIADPAFAAKALAGRPVRRCLGCNQDCIGRVGMNADLSCVVNPEAGREVDILPAPRLRTDADMRHAHVVVTGGGPAGLSAAAAAAKRGLRVTLLEAAVQVGGQLATAARGPHRGGLAHLVEDLLTECLESGVDVQTGVSADVAVVRSLEPDAVVVATGAQPAPLSWADAGASVVDAGSVLAGASTPSGSVLLVDELGSHAATSVAEMLAERGVDVEIVTPGLVVGQDLGLTLDLPGWKQRAAGLGIRESTEQVVLAVTADPERGEAVVTLLEHTTGRRAERRCSTVVVAAYPRPEGQLWPALRVALPADVPVLRVGDCLAPRQAGEAVRDGWAAAVSL
jgi:2,4-dienoyl-CoA reductase (NADPH2)